MTADATAATGTDAATGGNATRIAQRVAEVRALVAEACARRGRDPAAVRLIAVTKSQGPEVLTALAAAGVADVGENRVEHHALMHAAARTAGLDLRFHAIGRIQGRQLGELVPLSACLHSLADPGHLPRLARAAAGGTAPFPLFVQVNTSGEAAKAGVAPEALDALLRVARGHAELVVVGLMTMAPEGADEATLRRTFSRLRELAGGHGLPRLSMGMSQDFPIAVEEGATDIRVGTRLFS